MSLVSNFIGNISSAQVGSLTKASQNFDLNDTTFAKLLEKQMGEQVEEVSELPNLGMPAGFNIEPLEGIEEMNTVKNVQKIDDNNSNQLLNVMDSNENDNITTSEAVTFFTSFLNNRSFSTSEFSNILDFAQKQATNFYNKYSKDVITDVNEFVDDVKSMI